MLGIKLHKEKKQSMKRQMINYNKPAYVYIPLISQDDNNITVLVKKGDYVYKGSIIARRKGNFRIPIHASVSGTVTGFEEKYYLNGKLVKCVVIENDYKEKYEQNKGVKRVLSKYTKDEFTTILKECGVVGLSGSGFPTYVKYNGPAKIETLIINAVESEPYITSDYALASIKCEEILEGIDAIMEIHQIPEAIIAIKKTNVDLVHIFNNFIGTYLKIKIVLVPDSYTIGYEKKLINYIKKITYPTLPSYSGIVVNNIATIYAIYRALKYQQPLTERVVTFTGPMIKKPQNVMVKIGTMASEVIEQIGGYKKKKKIKFIAGGPMMGKSISGDDLAITPSLTCVIAIDGDITTEPPHACINCGRCCDNCPAKLSPSLIIKYKKSKRMIKKLEPSRCINCGVCSYICPAKIKVRDYVQSLKESSVD